jgi:NADH-quinone oxidoreductase subunit J
MMEAIVFWTAAAAALASGVVVVAHRNPVYSVMSLVVTLLSLATLFVMLAGHLLGILLVLVYAGAILVLFLFVIMLLNPAPLKERFASGPVLTGLTFALGVLFVASLMRGVMSLAGAGGAMAAVGEGYGSTRSVGEMLFTAYLYPFELAGVLLLVAMVGAVVLARRQVAGED